MYFSINLDFIQEHKSIYTFICLNQSNIINISQRHTLVFLVIPVLSTPGNYLKTFTLLSSLLCQSYHCFHNPHRHPKITITYTPELPAPPALTYTQGIFYLSNPGSSTLNFLYADIWQDRCIHCCGLSVCVPTKFIYWNLILKIMILGSVAFGKWLDDEWRALVSEINPLIKGEPRELSPLFCHVRTQLGDSCLWTRRQDHTRHKICWDLDLGFPSLQHCEK